MISTSAMSILVELIDTSEIDKISHLDIYSTEELVNSSELPNIRNKIFILGTLTRNRLLKRKFNKSPDINKCIILELTDIIKIFDYTEPIEEPLLSEDGEGDSLDKINEESKKSDEVDISVEYSCTSRVNPFHITYLNRSTKDIFLHEYLNNSPFYSREDIRLRVKKYIKSL